MKKLYLPIGMIGSGKSTWAKQFIKDKPNTKIVGGDEIRFMFGGGNYEYSPALEESIHKILYSATRILLADGYDVILDECYCSLNRLLRQDVGAHFIDKATLVAVVFPLRDMQDHIEDKIIKGLRGKTVGYWKNVFREMAAIYEPPCLNRERYFDDAIFI